MEIRQRQLGSIVCLDVAGRLVVGGQIGFLTDMVNSLFVAGHRQILLNLKEVSQIDAAGLAAITHVRAAAERHRGTLKLLSLPRRIHDLLVITRLITLFDVFESEADALASYNQQATMSVVTN